MHQESPPSLQDQTHPDSEEETLDEPSLQNFIAPAILEDLKHLDLSNKLTFNRKRAVAWGAYGDIFRGHIIIEGRGSVRVCAKRLRFHLPEDIKLLFEKEIYVWSKLKHPNVLPLLGFSFDRESGFPMLISEWMDNGSAWNYVSSHPECNLMHLISGIANGLAYLHKNSVIHSDLKSDNVLVTESGEAVICDFGCSYMLAASKSLANLSSGIKGTPRYWPPEFFTSGSQHSKMSDVWAFGMTVYELLTGQRPYGEALEHQIIGAILKQELPKLPEISTDRILPGVKEALWSLSPTLLRHSHSVRFSDMANPESGPGCWDCVLLLDYWSDSSSDSSSGEEEPNRRYASEETDKEGTSEDEEVEEEYPPEDKEPEGEHQLHNGDAEGEYQLHGRDAEGQYQLHDGAAEGKYQVDDDEVDGGYQTGPDAEPDGDYYDNDGDLGYSYHYDYVSDYYDSD